MMTKVSLIKETSYQIRLPQAFTHAKQLVRRGARDDKVLGKVDTAYAIKAADERLARLGIKSSNNRRDKVWTEAALVEG